MSLQALNAGGIIVFPGISIEGTSVIPITQTAADAAGESTSFIGYIKWDDGASHVVSSAGGKIYWIPNAATFANAGSTYRIGIQDVDTSTGLEDGTFDVHQDLIGGTDPITASVINTAIMASGSKTIAHNALIAVSLEMIARGGADTVSPQRINANTGLPYCSLDTGAGSSKNSTFPFCLVEADDGTLGALGPAFTIPRLLTPTLFNSGSTPDEYAIIFQVPFKCSINKIIGIIGELDAGETGNFKIYTDPLGTPTAILTVAVIPEINSIQSASVGFCSVDISETTLNPATTYAISYEATSTGNRLINRVTTIPSNNVRKFMIFGTTLQGGTRSDSTGVFSTADGEWPMLGFIINKLDDGVGGGGSTEHSSVF